MTPQSRFRVLQFDYLDTYDCTHIAVLDREKNEVVVLEAQTTSRLPLSTRRKKKVEPAVVPIVAVDPRQTTLDDSAFTDSLEFDPDPSYSDKPLL